MSYPTPSEYSYRAIFDGAPVAIWDEDFSQVKRVLDRLAERGVRDIGEYLREHPETVEECVRGVQVRHVNRAARQFYGAQSEQDLIAALPTLFDSTALDIFRQEISVLISGERSFEAELSVNTLGGERRRVLMNVSLLGEPEPDWSKVVVAFTDITERRRLEQSLRKANETLRRLNQHLEQFAYAAAHDMREPLRTISLYAQLLQRDVPPEPGTRSAAALKHIMNYARRMETLVSDLLAFTRAVEPQTMDAQVSETDAHVVLTEVISTLEASIEEGSAQIHTPSGLPAVRMQPVHLRQLFHNLLSNAIKYRSPSRPLQIDIAAEQTPTRTTFCVTDNGIGIRSDYHEQIFGIFKRLHGQEVEGNGIGLALCRKIVEDYGGQIWVESALDEGSRFYFALSRSTDGV